MTDFLLNCIPETPCTSYAIIHIVAILGGVMLIYAIFLEQERRRDLVMVIGGFALAIYAYFIGNKIFMFAMGGIALASLIEFIEIYLGLHKHSPEDLKKYKKLK